MNLNQTLLNNFLGFKMKMEIKGFSVRGRDLSDKAQLHLSTCQEREVIQNIDRLQMLRHFCHKPFRYPKHCQTMPKRN